MTFKTVLCWIFGIGGAITFILSLGMPIFMAGQYLILGLLLVVNAIYFHMKFKDRERPKLESE